MADTATAETESTEPQAAPEQDDRQRKRDELVGVKAESVLTPARFGFSPDQIDAIRAAIMPDDSTDAELVMLLEVAGRYELDPFAKQVFAAKIQGGIQIIVSRDGLLALAHRSPDFRGMVGDVVCKNDTFKVTSVNGEREVRHEYDFNADPATAEEPGRGEILGAWAMVKREGHDPTFFFAPWGEYYREARSGRPTPWQTHPTAMILKCAETYALRKAFSVSGVVGEEEIERAEAIQVQNLSELPEAPNYGDDDLGRELKRLVDALQEVDPASWRPAKVRNLINGADDTRRAELAAEMREALDAATETADAEVVGETE